MKNYYVKIVTNICNDKQGRVLTKGEIVRVNYDEDETMIDVIDSKQRVQTIPKCYCKKYQEK